jgi:membrane-associated phospholipid phosphatase
MSTVAERGPPPTREGPSREAQAVPGPESSFPIRRHPGDVLRVVVGGALLALSAAIASTERIGTLERDLFRLINHLPSALEVPLIGVMQAGAIAAVPACAAVALVAKRRRLARDLAVSGTTAWLLAKVVKDFVSRARPDALLSDVVVRHAGDTGLGFPSGHAAVAAALATAAGPFLPRRARHATWLVVALVSVGRVYVGSHLPDDVLGGVALGWMIGAAWHLAVGAPARGVTAGRVARVLETAGLGPVTVAPVHADARGSAPRVGGGCSSRPSTATTAMPTCCSSCGGTSFCATSRTRPRSSRPSSRSSTRHCSSCWQSGPAWGCPAPSPACSRGPARRCSCWRTCPAGRSSGSSRGNSRLHCCAPSGGRWIGSIVRGSPTATCGPRTCSSAAMGNPGSSTSGSRSCRPATAGWRRTSPSW